MKIAWVGLYFGLALTLAVGAIDQVYGLSGALTNTPHVADPDTIAQAWDWGGTGSLVGDISAGFRFFWDFNVPFIEYVPELLTNMGTPLYFVNMIKALWRLLWNSFLIEMITGRRIMYE